MNERMLARVLVPILALVAASLSACSSSGSVASPQATASADRNGADDSHALGRAVTFSTAGLAGPACRRRLRVATSHGRDDGRRCRSARPRSRRRSHARR